MANPKDVSDVVEGVALLLGVFGVPIAGVVVAAKKIAEGVTGLFGGNRERKRRTNEELLEENEVEIEDER